MPLDTSHPALPFSIEDKVRESNRIERILRDPTPEECAEFARFMALDQVTVSELCAFVRVCAPHARLRDRSGLDVSVGTHEPPPGGLAIPHMLDALLQEAHAKDVDPWRVHVQYEALHPFTDCNGRSGRMLWYWMMGEEADARLGFLHGFYYQTLRRARIG